MAALIPSVALRKESVDRNLELARKCYQDASLSARRAWIEIAVHRLLVLPAIVALRKESVDRNAAHGVSQAQARKSLSARRAWIEMRIFWMLTIIWAGRSPQGERG